MIHVVVEFDGASAASLALLDALPEALAGRSVVVTLRAVAPPEGDAPVPWMALLADPAPGRWVAEQVLRRGPLEPVEALGAALARTPGGLPAATGAVPAVLWSDRRFDGPAALGDFVAALPGVSGPSPTP